MANEPLKLRPQDPWSWRPALGADVDDLVTLTKRDFECEADSIFRTDPLVYGHNVTRAVVDQFYNPGTAFLWVARNDATSAVVAYVWAERGQRAPWSSDEMVAVKIVHLDMTLGPRSRMILCDEMIYLWEQWAVSIDVPIVCSTTMRSEQSAFLKLHEKRGYDVRGSIAYKRVATQATFIVPE